jgi:hypothetical protein
MTQSFIPASAIFPWTTWQNPPTRDTAMDSVVMAYRPLTPLLQFFNRLLMPQLVNNPTWFSGLELTDNNVKLFILDEAESEILTLFLDLTHRSFLQFCIYLVHDRLVEYSHLKKLFQFPICPIVITSTAVQTAIQSCMPTFEYKDLSTGHPSLIASGQFRQAMRASAPLHNIVVKSTTNYKWELRDKHDIISFKKLLVQLSDHPVYTYHTYREKDMTIEDLTNLRKEIFEKRYPVYTTQPVKAQRCVEPVRTAECTTRRNESDPQESGTGPSLNPKRQCSQSGDGIMEKVVSEISNNNSMTTSGHQSFAGWVEGIGTGREKEEGNEVECLSMSPRGHISSFCPPSGTKPMPSGTQSKSQRSIEILHFSDLVDTDRMEVGTSLQRHTLLRNELIRPVLSARISPNTARSVDNPETPIPRGYYSK